MKATPTAKQRPSTTTTPSADLLPAAGVGEEGGLRPYEVDRQHDGQHEDVRRVAKEAADEGEKHLFPLRPVRRHEQEHAQERRRAAIPPSSRVSDGDRQDGEDGRRQQRGRLVHTRAPST